MEEKHVWIGLLILCVTAVLMLWMLSSCEVEKERLRIEGMKSRMALPEQKAEGN